MDYESFLNLIKARHSCRSYQAKDVPEELIVKCLEAARLSPSACNKQPWRFIVVKNKESREKICSEGFLPCLPMPWLKDVPAFIVLCTKTNFAVHRLASFISKVDYRQIDIGIAGEHFVLAAQSLGLGTCWIGWFKEKAVKRILKIPSGVKILSLITLGYPSELKEQAQKLPLSNIFFCEEWKE